ncbi:MAG: hypothetical protein R3F11_20975 [Verrucomicrobiales bacterium]
MRYIEESGDFELVRTIYGLERTRNSRSASSAMSARCGALSLAVFRRCLAAAYTAL